MRPAPILALTLGLTLAACSGPSLHSQHRASAAAHAQAAQALVQTAPEGPALPPWLQKQRQRIEREQQAAQRQFETAEKACWQRFAVNDCIAHARHQRRQTESALRQQQLALNQLERRHEARQAHDPADPADQASQPPAQTPEQASD